MRFALLAFRLWAGCLWAGCVVDQRMGQRCADDDELCEQRYAHREPEAMRDGSLGASDAAPFLSAHCACDAGTVGTWDGLVCSGCLVPSAPAPDRCTMGRYAMESRIWYQSTASSVCGIVPLDPILYPATLALRLQARVRTADTAQITGCIVDENDGGIGWRAAFQGEMDCTTGKLEAQVRSTYNVVTLCTLGLLQGRFFAKGTFDGVLDGHGSATGNIDFREPKTLSGQYAGGSGSWTATFESTLDGPIVEQDECLGATFPEQAFLDAGI